MPVAKKSSTAVATVDQLLTKPVRVKTLELDLGGSKVQIKLRAIGAKEYDDLLAAHPPTSAQKKDDATYNVDTFPPALISETLQEPSLSVEQATELWNSPSWSRGELQQLFLTCVEVNATALTVPFGDNGSGTTLSSP